MYYFSIFLNKNYIINILLVIVLAIMTLIAKFAKFSMHKILRSCANDCIAKDLLIRCSGVAVLRKICFQVNALSCNRWYIHHSSLSINFMYDGCSQLIVLVQDAQEHCSCELLVFRSIYL